MTTQANSNLTGRRVLHNAAFLMTSQVFSWAIASIQAVVLPRYFGPEVAGQFFIGLSLWAVMNMFVAFGTDMSISRRVARGEGDLGELLGSALVPRVGLHLVGSGLLVLYTVAFGYSRQVLSVVAVFAVANLFVATASAYGAALYGLEQMRPISIISGLSKLVGTGLLLLLIWRGFGFEQVLLTSIPAGLILLVFQRRALQRYRPHRLTPRWEVTRSLFRESVPIFSNRFARNLYTQLDVIVVSWLVSETVVGWYSAADLLFGSLLFVPTVFGMALMPAIARTYADDPASSLLMTKRSFHLLLIAVVPIGFGVIAIAQPAIDLIYGADFAETGPVLAIFGPVVILTSMNTLLGQQLFAMNEERRLTKLMIVALAVAIPADLALILWAQERWGNGAIGAGLAYIVTEGLILIGSLRILPKHTLDRGTAWLAFRALLGGAAIVAATISFREQNLLIIVAVGALAYAVACLGLRLIGPADRQLLLGALRR